MKRNRPVYDLVIRNGTVVTADEAAQPPFKAHIGIRGEKIAAVSEQALEGKTVIDAEGKYVFPGVIDAHVHMALPVSGTISSDDFYTGTVAAAFGGVTTIIDYTTPDVNQNLLESVRERLKVARDAVIDYSFHAVILGWPEGRAEEIAEAIRQGISSFKLFMAYGRSRRKSDDGVLYQAFQAIGKEGGIAEVHAENDDIIEFYQQEFRREGKLAPKYHALARPDFSEGEAVARALYLAKEADAPLYLVHLSSAKAIDALVKSRRDGVEVLGETCPQYLVLTDEVYQTEDAHYFVISPPLRKAADRKRLWAGLAAGEFSVIATDHCPFMRSQKDPKRDNFLELPNGMPGVETLLPLIYSEGVVKKRITLQQMVQYLATNPAKIFGLFPEKGTIEVGSDADLVILDPRRRKRLCRKMLHMNVDFSPYEGMVINGYPEITIARGRIIVDEAGFHGQRGAGRFLKRHKPLREQST